jgi:hypothetical protein
MAQIVLSHFYYMFQNDSTYSVLKLGLSRLVLKWLKLKKIIFFSCFRVPKTILNKKLLLLLLLLMIFLSR